ncbi:MAG TPA: nitrilase-related carbon-nitrogen hydrolase [Deltaproteobacteria bacterium]|nr:nitrilase-related carbon-nitrogen hydrolase [Deltaproteobacteria bacterium]HOM28442.1 nitrilase-related carbon-nitrogen hydrolase [Deltaproteobacteria bacterium]HPP79681.1 nitrilase-related carbon-nitrogen hydrolase [Deltaproteobacteria bacterium]
MELQDRTRRSSDRRLSVGICQLRQGYDVEANIERACELIGLASGDGADICVLPEMFSTPYEPVSIRRAAALSASALERVCRKASELGVYVVAGSLPWPSGDGRLYNRAFVVDPKGEAVYHHDKIHLFDCAPCGGPNVRESETVAPGSSLGSFTTPWCRASVIVCYDVRFVQLVQVLADMGVRLLFVPAAFSSATGEAHWEMLVRIRALELQGYVVGVQPAVNEDLAYVPWGRSVLASPWGEVLARAGTDEEVIVTEIDMTYTDEIRSRFPLLAHRRADLYETRWKGKG